MVLNEPRIPIEHQIAYVEDKFDRWIIPAIKAVAKSSGSALAFVLISCGIDYLGGFFTGGRSTETGYIDLLDSFDWFKAKYSSSALYKSLRCGLVHNFTIHNGTYALTNDHPEQHLMKTTGGYTFLNLNDFISDFEKLKREYFQKVMSDQGYRRRFLKHYEQFGFLGYFENIPL